MQPCSREMQAINTLLNQQQQSQMSQLMPFDTTSLSSHDDYFEQMLSSINNPSSCSSWPDLSNPNPNPSPNLNTALRTAVIGAGAGGDDEAAENGVVRQYGFDDEEEDHQSSAFLASKLRHHQINDGGSDVSAASTAAAKALMLHQQLMLSRGLAGNGLRSPASGEHNLLPMPLGLGNDDQNDVVDGSSFKSANPANDSSVQALFNGFSGSLGQTTNPPQQFHHPQGGPMQAQNFGAPAVAAASQAAPPSGSTGAGAPTQPKQQRVRARRGQATDPHSIAERLRRERIAERMKSLQELVPNGNKTDKASMLDEIIDYVKFLQLQVKVLSMSRLGGAAAVAPLVADMSSEAGGEGGRTSGTQTKSPPTNDGMTVTEHQVAKLMEEDMGSAMQYLQGKGLCLMPISLATAISTATCHSRNPMNFNKNNNTGRPTSPSVSVLTVANGVGEASVKDAASVSKS